MSDELPVWQLEFRALATKEIQARINRILENREFLSVWQIPVGWRESQERTLLAEAWALFDTWVRYCYTSPLEPSLETKWPTLTSEERTKVVQTFIAHFYNTKQMHHW